MFEIIVSAKIWVCQIDLQFNFRYEDLILDEKRFCAEIENYSKKFEEWSAKKLQHFTDLSEKTSSQKNGEVLEEQIPEEVILFEVFYLRYFI